jgi:hypothetical protein
MATCERCTDLPTCRCLCGRILAAMPSSGGDREEGGGESFLDVKGRAGRTYFPESGSTHATALTWAENMIGERPPDEWDRKKRMAFDKFVNHLTLAEIARKYRVNKFTAKSQLASIRKNFSSAFSIGRTEQFKEGGKWPQR